MSVPSQRCRLPEVHFVEGDAELETFRAQLGIKTMGEYAPGEPPTVFHPLETLNPAPEATLLHEQIHQELTLSTAYGSLFKVVFPLARFGRFTEESQMLFENQWTVQEGCATYTGLSLIASRQPDYYPQAVARLPSFERKQAPYREVFQAVCDFLPITPGASAKRLRAQSRVVVAIGRCCLNNDCLVRFANPAALTSESLKAYLRSASPDNRFGELLQALYGRNVAVDLVAIAENSEAAGENPTPAVMAQIARDVPSFHFTTFEEMVVEFQTFRANWEEVCQALVPSDSNQTVDFGNYHPGKIPARRVQTGYGPSPMSLDDVRQEFVGARDGKHGLWVVIQWTGGNDALKLDLCTYPIGQGGNPASEQEAAKAFLRFGFRGNEFRAQAVRELCDEFPGLPHAMMFTNASWIHWDRLSTHSTARPLVEASLSHELRMEYVERLVAFRELRKSAEYFVMKYDDEQAFAYIADPDRPGIYALQYLAGNAGLMIFREIVRQLNIPEMKDYEEKIRHLPLLRLFAFPAFVTFAEG